MRSKKRAGTARAGQRHQGHNRCVSSSLASRIRNRLVMKDWYWKYWILPKFALQFKYWDLKKRIKSKIFCKIGYHNIYRSMIGTGGSSPGKRSWSRKSHYIACHNCNYLYFSNLKDAKNYKWITRKATKREKDMFKKVKRWADEQNKSK